MPVLKFLYRFVSSTDCIYSPMVKEPIPLQKTLESHYIAVVQKEIKKEFCLIILYCFYLPRMAALFGTFGEGRRCFVGSSNEKFMKD